MEPKQFDKIAQWFNQLNLSVKKLATKDLVENKFNMLLTAMKTLFDRNPSQQV